MLRRLLGFTCVLAAIAAPAARADSPLAPLAARFAPAAPASTLGWCGTSETAADRPDVVGGAQVRVVYAIPSDGLDRFFGLAGPIVSDIADVDAWWREQDPTRTPRFDLADFPNCPPGLGQLDIAVARLPQPASVSHPAANRLSHITSDLATVVPLDPYKKYLVYYDGPSELANQCGVSPVLPLTGGVAAIWMNVEPTGGCGSLGIGEYEAVIAAHELTHNLGAVQLQAPHFCTTNPFHVCDYSDDLMHGDASLYAYLEDYQLDVNHDDYYAHSGSWFDVQDSIWLRHLDGPQFSLEVTLAGAGPGDTVKSDLPGIDCPSQCSTTLDRSTSIALTPTAGSGSQRFVRWTGGGCANDIGTCAVTMDTDKTVQAVFGPSTYRIAVRVTGKGRVTAPGFACARRCTKAFDAGYPVVFKARPARGWKLATWTGACRGHGSCRVGVNAARQLGATFRRVARHS